MNEELSVSSPKAETQCEFAWTQKTILHAPERFKMTALKSILRNALRVVKHSLWKFFW